MADPIGTAHQGATSSGQGARQERNLTRRQHQPKALSEQAMAAGKDLTDKAKDLAETLNR